MKSALFLFLVFISFQAFGQKEYDKRLLAKYSEEQIRSLQTKHPSLIEFMSFYLDNGYQIETSNGLKTYELAGELNLPRLSRAQVNIFELGVPLPLDKPVVYTIKNSDQLLILHSRKSVVNKFNRTKE